MNWDLYWQHELFRRAADPLDFRRWKRDSQRELARLHPGGVRLLDATAGLGDHTVNLAEEGFRVEACDASAVARDATLRAVRDARLDVPVFDVRWHELGDARPAHYDVVFHDALHWIYDPADLMAAVRGLFASLAPGGALVFFFADAASAQPGAGLEILAWDLQHFSQSPTLGWDHRVGDRRVTLAITREPGPDFVDERHRYTVQDGDAPPFEESLTLRRVYRWDWHALAPVLHDAGFTDLRTDHFTNVKGHGYALSRAFRPHF